MELKLDKRKKSKIPPRRYKASERLWLTCKLCHNNEVLVFPDIIGVTCADCVQLMIEPPEYKEKVNPKDKKPRGWHFKSHYVAPDGKTYAFGKLVGEKKSSRTPKSKKKNAKSTSKKSRNSKKVSKRKPRATT